MTNLTGFVNILKPTGATSSDVVIKVKKILKTKKVGHLGTLDPAASGVLPIAIGKATKFFDYFLNKDKEYYAIVKFGVETDTLDAFGNITNKDYKIIKKQDIINAIPAFTGNIMQVPPKYSAVKVNGKRAYDLARENVDFEIKPKQIKTHSIELVNELGDNMFLFKVNCSAGTYIRSLFYDIAKHIGTISATPVIIRTVSGRFNQQNAITLDELESAAKILDIKEVFADTIIIKTDEKIAKKLINGVKIHKNELILQKNDIFSSEFFIEFNNKIIGLYCIRDEKVTPIVYLYEGD